MSIQRMKRTTKFTTNFIVSMSMYLDGHLHAHSAMETDDTCGNCDGGNCETCEPVYQVEVSMVVPAEVTGKYWDEEMTVSWRRFENEKTALEHFETLCEVYSCTEEVV